MTGRKFTLLICAMLPVLALPARAQQQDPPTLEELLQ